MKSFIILLGLISSVSFAGFDVNMSEIAENLKECGRIRAEAGQANNLTDPSSYNMHLSFTLSALGVSPLQEMITDSETPNSQICYHLGATLFKNADYLSNKIVDCYAFVLNKRDNRTFVLFQLQYDLLQKQASGFCQDHPAPQRQILETYPGSLSDKDYFYNAQVERFNAFLSEGTISRGNREGLLNKINELVDFLNLPVILD